VVWEFLVGKVGGNESATALTDNQIRDYAGDFLDSPAEGRTYWPLSESIGLWQFKITHGEVWDYLTKLMLKEARKRPAAPFTANSEARPTNTGTGSKRTPQNGRGGRSTVSKSDPKSSGPRTPPAKTHPPRNRAMSPTVAPDIHHDADATVQTPREKIRSTPNKNSERRERPSSSRGLGPLKSPVKAGKRPIARDEDFEMSGALGISSPERQPKRIALNPPPESSSAAQTVPSVIIPPIQDTEPAALSNLTTFSPTPNQNEHDIFTGVPHGHLSTSLISVRGLQYSVRNLSKVPDSILDYVAKCVRHQLRLAVEATEPSLKDKYRAQSTLLNNLHADLESRIVCLSEDAAERDRVESSYCLWN
jgi:hypothetical protein